MFDYSYLKETLRYYKCICYNQTEGPLSGCKVCNGTGLYLELENGLLSDLIFIYNDAMKRLQ